MQIAIVDNVRVRPTKFARAVCPQCGEPVIAKCGPRVTHHWAHLGRKNCDPWHENETEWHKSWKMMFPNECVEVTHFDENGEIHRADIKTPTGVFIEVQHSPISDAERISREEFYKNLTWVVDASVFSENFYILHMLPDPNASFMEDIVWLRASANWRHGNHWNEVSPMYFKLSEHREMVGDPAATKKDVNSGYIHGFVGLTSEFKEQVLAHYRGHHQYIWIRPRKTWLDARCPVYMDFGGDFLARLQEYDESGLPCVRLISKKKFYSDVNTVRRAEDIASTFYPLR